MWDYLSKLCTVKTPSSGIQTTVSLTKNTITGFTVPFGCHDLEYQGSKMPMTST